LIGPFTWKENKGPYLVALQHENDAPLQHYFPGKRKDEKLFITILKILAENIGNVPVLVVPHPRYMKEWDAAEEECLHYFLPKWKLIKNKRTKDLFEVCRGLITVNSTTTIEGIIAGIPVATLGLGVFSGAQVTFECVDQISRLRKFEHYRAAGPKVLDFLCALYRHQLPVKPLVEDVQAHPDFKIWVARAKKGETTDGTIGRNFGFVSQFSA
jgi:capsule polysaccharide modification protein KpsS